MSKCYIAVVLGSAAWLAACVPDTIEAVPQGSCANDPEPGCSASVDAGSDVGARASSGSACGTPVTLRWRASEADTWSAPVTLTTCVEGEGGEIQLAAGVQVSLVVDDAGVASTLALQVNCPPGPGVSVVPPKSQYLVPNPTPGMGGARDLGTWAPPTATTPHGYTNLPDACAGGPVALRPVSTIPPLDD